MGPIHKRRVVVAVVGVALVAVCTALGWWCARQMWPPRTEAERVSAEVGHGGGGELAGGDVPAPSDPGAIVVGRDASYDPPGMTGREVESLCAVNCLHMVNKYHRMGIGYGDLKALLDPSGFGVSVAKLVEVAESIGYQSRVLEAPVEDWLEFSSPLIVWVDGGQKTSVGHFVVVVPRKQDRQVWWVDPPNRGRWVKISQIKVKSAPVVVLEPRGG